MSSRALVNRDSNSSDQHTP